MVTALPFVLLRVPPFRWTLRLGEVPYWLAEPPYICVENSRAEPSVTESPLTGAKSSSYVPVPVTVALSSMVIVPILASMPVPPVTDAVPPMVSAPSMGQ